MSQYFCYDGESMQFFETADEAREHAESALGFENELALEGWTDASMDICWGQLSQIMEVVNQTPTEEDSPYEFYEDRILVDTISRMIETNRCPKCHYDKGDFYHKNALPFPSFCHCKFCGFYLEV